jgi:hypothetical protein
VKVWRAVVVVALVVAGLVILAMAILEAQGRIHMPWPTMVRQMGGRFPVLAARRLAGAGAYIDAVAGLLLQFLIGTLILYVAPERMRRLTDAVAAGWLDLLRYLLVGLLAVAGLGAVALLSAFYVHTIGLPFLLGAILILAALIGSQALALALGRGLLRRAAWAGGSPLVSLLVGTVLLYAVTRVPLLAPLGLAVMGTAGAGAALTTRFGGRRTWTLDPLREVEPS